MTPVPEVRLAIYDLDRTITSLPTWSPFLWRSAPRWRRALLPVVGLAAIARAAGVIDRDRLKETMHRLMLGKRLMPAEARALAEAFADYLVPAHIRSGASAHMAADRREGRRIVIATAAHRFYAEAIAARLGVADLVATEAVRDPDGALTGRIAGSNCYGDAKQAMLARWLVDQGIDRTGAHIRFYSDHVTDAATFEWADEAVAVNPHAALRRLAGARGWRVVDWG